MQVQPRRSFIDNPWLWIALIVPCTFIALYPSLLCQWTNWDDQGYVLDCKLIRSLSIENIVRMFSRDGVVLMNYHPLTMLSYAVDYHFVQLSPPLYHGVNLFLHLLNTVLVFRFIQLLSGNRMAVAGFCALFFGIHPMHVESVTWVAERKDVLYTFFFLFALIAYLKYGDSLKIHHLILTLVFFYLSILSKAMAVVLPVVLVLMDYYRGRPLFTARCVGEKIPFFLLSLYYGWLATSLQYEGAIGDAEVYSWFQRGCIGFYGIFTYLWKFLLPINLSNLYPYPIADAEGKWPGAFMIQALLGMFLAALAVTYVIWKRDRHVIFGLGFFLVTILLVLQFITVGIAIIADRYSYVSYIGLLFLVGLKLDEWTRDRSTARTVLGVALICLALVFGAMTFARARVWTTADTLWSDVIRQYPYPPWRVETAYACRAFHRAKERGELDRGLQDYQVLVQMNTKDHSTYADLGTLYGIKSQQAVQRGDALTAREFCVKSIDCFTKAISLKATEAKPYMNRAIAHISLKQFDEAFADFAKALEIDSADLDVLRNRGAVYMDDSVRRFDLAVQDFDTIIASEPGNVRMYLMRGVAQLNLKQFDKALNDLQAVIKLESNNGEAHARLSNVYSEMGDVANALAFATKANQLGYRIDDALMKSLQDKVK